MKTEELSKIENWFKAYIRTLPHNNGDMHPFLKLKVEHSKRVAKDTRCLAQDIDWPLSDVNVAETLGLLHDIGRFSQLIEFGTFDDAESVNHGERGWNIITQSNVLSSLSNRDQKRILDGVHYHNSKMISEHLDNESLPFVKLIRDADKLDIFRVVQDAVQRDGFQELSEMLPQVTLDGPINPKVIKELNTHNSCSIGDIKSLADFLLMQLSWFYDINYAPTFQRIVQRNLISNIAEKLPQDNKALDDIVAAVEHFVADNI